ncbi:MAG TPA: hypothetical protein DEP05_05520 [Betaproteobacteria bacterium]|nr:hypothetical protein [Betaproteobacteria bacterium]
MKFDVIVVGSGPGGYKAAITAAHLGARVALIEAGLAGGTCLNQGCIPKKTLFHLATLIESVNDLQGRGLTGRVGGDFTAAMRHKTEVVDGIRNNFSVWLRRLGIRFFNGRASLLDSRHIQVQINPDAVHPGGGDGPVVLETEKIILATGSRPKELSLCPTDGRQILHSRDFMFKLSHLPRSILFVGGGAVGVELGFLLHQFGARVTIVEHGAMLLDTVRLPQRAKVMLERKFKRIGVEVRKNTTVVACDKKDDGVTVHLSDGSVADYEMVLVAVGRQPYTEGMGLENAGVELTPDGFIRTTEYLETSIRGIYAIGDVKKGPMNANAALHDAKVAAANAVKGNLLRPNYLKVPVVFDTAFEIAAVGLTEDQADDAGFEAEAVRLNLGGSGKARAQNDYEGFAEVVHDAETGQLLGGCVVGPEAGEQIHMMAAACQSTRGLWFFKDMSYSHPSWSEELETVIDPYTTAFAQSQPGIFANTD